MQSRLIAAAAVAALVVAGCSPDDDPVGFESIAPSPSPSEDAVAEPEPEPTEEPSPAAVVDPSVVPPVEEMTVEYVEAVVNAIEAESGKLFAAVLAEPVNPLGATPAGTLEGLDALYGGDFLALNIEEAEALARSDEARALTLPADAYVGVTYDILQVSYAEEGCLVAVGQLNRDGSSVEGGDDPALSYLSLVRSTGEQPNPTPWEITESIANTSSTGEINSTEAALGATLEDLASVMANDCTGGESSRVP